MKDRFFRFRRLLPGVLALLMIGGLMYSCSDDYDLPDKTPEWLGESIYNYLKNPKNTDGVQRTFNNTVKLIDDLDYTEVLAKTGSKTLFVADDAAYERFFKNNPWNVHDYSELTQSQKKLLLNSCMLDNAYLLEMMPNLSSSSRGEDGTYLSRNRCLRQATSLAITDSIPHFDSTAVPRTYNLGLKNAGATPDADYWKRFRDPAKGGITMALDGTVPMMVHWIAGQMGEQKITDEDFEVIASQKREPNDVHIFGSKVVQQDIACQNGYIDVLDEVFTTPSNMAEMIRLSGKTNIFSHMLDRFSAPFYNRELTASYRQLFPDVDSVFEKRYLSWRSKGGARIEYGPNQERLDQAKELKYDPGWNTFYSASYGAQIDMASMYIPSDAALVDYFVKEDGGGRFLMDAYATEPNTEENLIFNLDQIPLEVIQALINNMMQESFINYVPSKYLAIMNDARDPMFGNVESLSAFKALIDTSLIANNGVVYVMNKVYTPARYAAVSAPVLVSDSARIFNWVITCDDPYQAAPASAPLQKNFSAYLLAMSTNFSLFVPTDRAMAEYYDPVSMAKQQPFVISFSFNSRGSNPIQGRAKRYDKLTGEVDSVYMPNSTLGSGTSLLYNRLCDIFETHVVVDSTAAKLGVEDGNEYFISKGGAPVKVVNATARKDGMKAYGAWQLEHNQECTVQDFFDKSERTNGYGNGFTYIIDHPLQTTVNSVYKVLTDDFNEDSPYLEFYNLCQVNPDVVERAGFVDSYRTIREKQTALAKYNIFVSDNSFDQNVRFFNTYRYTVYVPTNDAVKEQFAKGLPTWETIEQYLDEREAYVIAHENDPGFDVDSATTAYKETAQAMITCLLNFVKYHFQDNSIFVDNNPIESTSYETACINNVTNRYLSVTVQSAGGHTLNVTDLAGQTRHVITENGEDRNYNIMTRDLELNNADKERATEISTSSYAVIHRIDGVLNFKTLDGGRYDSDWATTTSAKRFVNEYRIRK